jgi:D-lactate dehydrogenase
MKITLFEITEEDKNYLTPMLVGMDAIYYKEPLSIKNADLAKEAEIISVFVNSEVHKDLIDQLPNLKFIVTASTGYDHIDIAYAKEKGIPVANVPAYGSQTVAEFTFALLLTLSRKIYWASHALREESSFDLTQREGFDLEGKTMGVIGTGKIGQNVVRIAKGFNINVIATDPRPKEDLAKQFGFEYVDLDTLLQKSDIITIHVPYLKETHHLINHENLGKVKKGAILINTARGEIVETEALVKALAEGRLGGAGIDVLEGERELKQEKTLLTEEVRIQNMRQLLEDHVLIDMPQVVVTPHMAFFTKEAIGRIMQTTADNIKNFIAGKPQNIVN